MLTLSHAAPVLADHVVMDGRRRWRIAADRSGVWPVVGALVALLAVAPVRLAMSEGGRPVSSAAVTTLGDVARQAGCQLHEYDHDPGSNPPVTGRVDERISARDGSYVGRRAPSALAATHALLHGRVVIQYRAELPRDQVGELDRLVGTRPTGALLFANRTNMTAPVAATAYLTLMTCPRVDAATLVALREFRARRANFGQGF
jgi:Protein of unknown function (DUF3105)